jgi:sporulation protein YlmC with PRC-barrel domain
MALHTGRRLLAASTIEGTPVQNQAGEDLGEINELMIDLEKGRIAYAVLSFGGFLGLGDKLFARPCDVRGGRFLHFERVQRLEQAEGFDKDRWPDMAA